MSGCGGIGGRMGMFPCTFFARFLCYGALMRGCRRHDVRTDWPSGKRKFIVEIDPSSHIEGSHEFRISAIIT